MAKVRGDGFSKIIKLLALAEALIFRIKTHCTLIYKRVRCVQIHRF